MSISAQTKHFIYLRCKIPCIFYILTEIENFHMKSNECPRVVQRNVYTQKYLWFTANPQERRNYIVFIYAWRKEILVILMRVGVFVSVKWRKLEEKCHQIFIKTISFCVCFFVPQKKKHDWNGGIEQESVRKWSKNITSCSKNAILHGQGNGRNFCRCWKANGRQNVSFCVIRAFQHFSMNIEHPS